MGGGGCLDRGWADVNVRIEDGLEVNVRIDEGS